ncbi:unnamed protein product [Periconia digitata]|uniref:Uncharacterized protein n=1 Tax=Periconia digitata TaxID=1303443 RepID=A0A9W4U9P1_9PLEO|nr:unnamed protein product [Periconia digitata]
MESYTPERMVQAIALAVPANRAPEDSPLARKHTRSLGKKQNMPTISSSSSASSSSDNESDSDNDVPNERTPLFNHLQTPKPKQGTGIYASPARPIASPSPLKNGNYEVEADFLQAMMIVLEREANMNRSEGIPMTHREVKKIVRKELKRADEAKQDCNTDEPSPLKPSRNERRNSVGTNKVEKEGTEECEDERKARLAVRAAFSLSTPTTPYSRPPPPDTYILIQNIVRDELSLQSHSPTQKEKHPHEYISPSTILRASITIAGLEAIRRIFEHHPQEAKWIFGGAGKAGAYVFGGFLAAKGFLWSVEQWWADQDEEGRLFRGEYGVVGGNEIAGVGA